LQTPRRLRTTRDCRAAADRCETNVWRCAPKRPATSSVAHWRVAAASGAAVLETRRQRSEQYLTVSQLRAQALRQVIGRAQTTQVRVGKDCLLPRKPDDFPLMVAGPQPAPARPDARGDDR
jgi:hypothetical protein